MSIKLIYFLKIFISPIPNSKFKINVFMIFGKFLNHLSVRQCTVNKQNIIFFDRHINLVFK